MAEVPVIICDVQRGGPSTGMPTSVEQSDLNVACLGGHGDSPRVVLAPASVEDCFYTAIEAVNVARKYNVPVFILSDQSIATRIEAFEEPNLQKHCQDLTPDLSPVDDYIPYPLDGEVRPRVVVGTPILSGRYPIAGGLEHDELGHPTAAPKLHQQMTARRRGKLQRLAAELPVPAVYGPPEGDILLVGWGSTQGPIREAVDRSRAAGDSVSALHLRHISPLPPGLENIFAGFNHVTVIEMNDEGLYGYGQLASLLRARYCLQKIQGLNKTDGLTWRVREILERVKSDVATGLSKL
jgi:2-oxoglutarate ferredoxin oxidoreductase subunit alpha